MSRNKIAVAKGLSTKDASSPWIIETLEAEIMLETVARPTWRPRKKETTFPTFTPAVATDMAWNKVLYTNGNALTIQYGKINPAATWTGVLGRQTTIQVARMTTKKKDPSNRWAFNHEVRSSMGRKTSTQIASAQIATTADLNLWLLNII